MSRKGIFYIIATPIGNLGDITYRAVEILRTLEVLYCEDTRTTAVLLKKYDIHIPHLRSFHAQSNVGQIDGIIKELYEGRIVGYVSDAGTPGISDPGGLLVSRIRESESPISVIPIPGASAVITLLSVSGFDTHQYRYCGFLPTKKGRSTMVKDIVMRDIVSVFYESVHRFERMLKDFSEFEDIYEINLCIGREMTKMFETFYTDTPTNLCDHFKNNPDEVRGEFAVAVWSKKRKILHKE